ncbi:MAG: hypothetical protein AAF492_27070, partial [Verrucomicrobiota bacterium]
MIAVAIIFLIPTYYMAKSKGYPAAMICVISGVLTFGFTHGQILTNMIPFHPYLHIIIPGLILFAVWIMPPRKNAPGEKYLKIEFTCTECNQNLSFHRSQEGRAVQCPQCDEIITVPEDEYSPKPIEQVRQKPSVD